MKKFLLLIVICVVCVGCGEIGDKEGEISVSEKDSKKISLEENFGFNLEVFSEYKREYLPNKEGILLKKWDEEGICKNEEGDEYKCGYKIEVSLYGIENLMNYSDVYSFINEKYGDYSVGFLGEGVFVNEGIGEDAFRHYFIMSKNSDMILDSCLKLKSNYYSKYQEEFDEFVGTIKVI